MISVYNDGFRDRSGDPSGDSGASVSPARLLAEYEGGPKDSWRGGRTGRAALIQAAASTVRVRIMGLRAAHIRKPSLRF